MKFHFETTVQEENFAEVAVKTQTQQESQWPMTLSSILEAKNLILKIFLKTA